MREILAIWNFYCLESNPKVKPRSFTKKFFTTQKLLSEKFVYFISLLQLKGGFRIGEVFFSYRSKQDYYDLHLNLGRKEMASYWEENDGNWVLHIIDSKQKNRRVPIKEKILSLFPPPEGINFTCENNNSKDRNKIDGEGKYYTELMEIIFALFPKSPYTFPSPNYIQSPNKPRSINYYNDVFKKAMVQKNEWDAFGIQSPHDLRHFFISYLLRKPGTTPQELCEITGHSIQTMFSYYVRENLQVKVDLLAQTDFSNITEISMERNEKTISNNESEVDEVTIMETLKPFYFID